MHDAQLIGAMDAEGLSDFKLKNNAAYRGNEVGKDEKSYLFSFPYEWYNYFCARIHWKPIWRVLHNHFMIAINLADKSLN